MQIHNLSINKDYAHCKKTILIFALENIVLCKYLTCENFRSMHSITEIRISYIFA